MKAINDTGFSASPPRPPRRRRPMPKNSHAHAWLVWAIAASFVLFQFFIQLSSGEIIGGLMQSFHLSAFGGGLLASAYYYVYVILQAPAGILIDRFGPRRLLTLGALVATAGAFCFGGGHALWLALMGRLLMGAGCAFAFVGALHLIAQWFPIERFAFMVSISEAFGMLGTVLGGVALAALILDFGWRHCMLGAGIIAFIIASMIWVFVRDMPSNVTPIAVQAPSHFFADLKKLFVKPVAWINGIYGGLIFSLVTVFLALWAVPYLQAAHHLSLFTATEVDDIAFVGLAIGCPIIGWLDNRYPHWRRRVLVVSALASAALLSIVIYLPDLPLFLLAPVLLLLGMVSTSYVLNLAIANEIALPSVRATSIGFANMLAMITAPLLQPLIGWLLGGGINLQHLTMTHYEKALTILPVLLLVAAFLGRYLPQRAS
ncbi:MAG: MFS transporter [Gammaproteobacteria bacterium]|nr:MFS transporter [Gammaproteobacteria bacterium]